MSDERTFQQGDHALFNYYINEPDKLPEWVEVVILHVSETRIRFRYVHERMHDWCLPDELTPIPPRESDIPNPFTLPPVNFTPPDDAASGEDDE